MRRLFVAFLLLALSASQALSQTGGFTPYREAGAIVSPGGAAAGMDIEAKRVCWHKVLVPASHGALRAVVFASCTPDPKHFNDFALSARDGLRSRHEPASSPHLSPHEPGRLFRPPIA